MQLEAVSGDLISPEVRRVASRIRWFGERYCQDISTARNKKLRECLRQHLLRFFIRESVLRLLFEVFVFDFYLISSY